MSILIKTYVTCNSCQAKVLGHKTMVGTPQKTKARDYARKLGWRCSAQGSNPMNDTCPKCLEKERRDEQTDNRTF